MPCIAFGPDLALALRSANCLQISVKIFAESSWPFFACSYNVKKAAEGPFVIAPMSFKTDGLLSDWLVSAAWPSKWM